MKRVSCYIKENPVYSKYHFYLFQFKKDFSFIQQESTFWTRELWEQAGDRISLDYSLASDFDLWLRFFRYAELYCTKKQLAAFRKRKGQKSDDGKKYLEEAEIAVQKQLKFKSIQKNRLDLRKYLEKNQLSNL